jgi:hypothetical protein
MANTRTNGPHLSFRKDGEVGGYWTTTLPGGGEGGGCTNHSCLSAQPSWQLSNAAEHWPRRLSLSHQRIARGTIVNRHMLGEPR